MASSNKTIKKTKTFTETVDLIQTTYDLLKESLDQAQLSYNAPIRINQPPITPITPAPTSNTSPTDAITPSNIQSSSTPDPAAVSMDTNQQSTANDTADPNQQQAKSTGVVKWFNYSKKYGFIVPDDQSLLPEGHMGDGLYVHALNILKSKICTAKYRTLQAGEMVEFNTTSQKSGKLEAICVTGPNGANVQGIITQIIKVQPQLRQHNGQRAAPASYSHHQHHPAKSTRDLRATYAPNHHPPAYNSRPDYARPDYARPAYQRSRSSYARPQRPTFQRQHMQHHTRATNYYSSAPQYQQTPYSNLQYSRQPGTGANRQPQSYRTPQKFIREQPTLY